MQFKFLLNKIKETLISVLPISVMVILLNFTPLVNFATTEIIIFLVCTLCLIVGIGLFNLGADLAMSPMGEYIGVGLTKSKKLWIIILVCFAMGLLITVAEPDLSVLASQLESVIKPNSLIFAVGAGVGLFLVVSVLKILFKKDLSSLLLFFYLVMFALTSLVILNERTALLALAFDSGGVTTGPITVPFIMALGIGIASSIGGKDASENSFGLIALCSVGPIVAVMILAISSDESLIYTIPDYSIDAISFGYLVEVIQGVSKGILRSVIFIFGFFVLINASIIKLPVRKVARLLNGIIITIIGLVIFLSAVEIGFMPIGYKLGQELATSPFLLITMGFLIGAVVVLAEPAVHVLNNQVADVTNGLVSKKAMTIALCIGVGISIGLSMLRIVLDFSILYYLIPGYLLSLGLSLFVPKIYTGIAFDSGGVASGPLTSSFILPLAVGACIVLNGEDGVLYNAFGVVAMVAMTPLITIQCLGFSAIYHKKRKQKYAIKKISNASDKQIIRFR